MEKHRTCACAEVKDDRPHGSHHHGGHGHDEASRWRTIAPLGLSLALFVTGLVMEHLFGDRRSVIPYLLAYATVGWDVAKQVVLDLRDGEVFTENLLMTTASLGAFAIGHHGEAAAVMVFYTLGEVLQGMAVRKSRSSIKAAMDLKPDRARMIVDGVEMELDPKDVRVGEAVVVRPGDKVPLDGIVAEGDSHVDMSKITGEFVPKRVAPGSEVLAGTINGTGLIKVRVSKPYGLSTAARIMRSVEEAEDKKAVPERFIRRFARYYTPAAFAVAVTVAAIPPMLGYGSFQAWLGRGLVILVMACPCALVISVPLAYFAGMGRISRYGVLVKGAAFVDVLAGLDTIVFDKTGTLTEGSFEVREVVPIGKTTKEELVRAAASAEGGSAHPIASSIMEYAKDLGIEKSGLDIAGYSEIPGKGVIASVDGREIAVGNRGLMGKVGASYFDPGCSDPACSHTVAGVAVDGDMIGSLHLGDMPKEMAFETVSALKGLGVSRIAMLSGDKKEAAAAMAGIIGVDEVHAGLLPHEKLEELERIMSSSRKTAFVGDGVNDAPSLARADLGIAMGALGSDAAIETADMVVMDDNLNKLPKAIGAARFTRAVAMQNIFGALAVKAVFLVMGGIGRAGMVEAIIADVGLTLLTVLNSFRLFAGAKGGIRKIPDR
ncbi:MAG TPA: heavy metal translocating P-type ATPase [Bacillota bacterium]|nr:MAG: Zinc-transporting ATPase [Firmicutes bacterium ADurb.Bin153]HNV35148.1 heavy metal translocating P-type ATPase [Bacillota bacterium]HPU95401.1 heavy metal translocating P-type ATPase [Bacillota bacterium]